MSDNTPKMVIDNTKGPPALLQSGQWRYCKSRLAYLLSKFYKDPIIFECELKDNDEEGLLTIKFTHKGDFYG